MGQHANVFNVANYHAAKACPNLVRIDVDETEDCDSDSDLEIEVDGIITFGYDSDATHSNSDLCRS